MNSTIVSNEIIKAKIDKLPTNLKQEVLNYIDFLLEKSKNRKNKENFTFTWEDALSELRNEYTSVELQHKAMEWR